MAAGRALYANFTGYGLYAWDGTGWVKLNAVTASGMIAFDSELYADFTGYGLYRWDKTAWSQLTPNSPAVLLEAF